MWAKTGPGRAVTPLMLTLFGAECFLLGVEGRNGMGFFVKWHLAKKTPRCWRRFRIRKPLICANVTDGEQMFSSFRLKRMKRMVLWEMTARYDSL